MIFINYLLDNIDKYYQYFDNIVISNILSNNITFNLNHIHLYGNAGSMKNFYVYYIINKLTKNSIKHDNIKIHNNVGARGSESNIQDHWYHNMDFNVRLNDGLFKHQ